MRSISLLLLASCGTVEIPDISPGVTLPYSGNCYTMSTVTHVRKETPKAECEAIKRRSIYLTSEDWRKLKFTLSKNCMQQKCKQAIGALDTLFITIDQTLQQIPMKGN